MADTGWVIAGAGTTLDDGIPWYRPVDITASDGLYSSVTIKGSDLSASLVATSFGFDVPNNVIITGVEVRIERRRDIGSGSVMFDHTVQLVKGGTAQGSNYADVSTDWPTTDATKDYGGASDLWGLTLVPSDVNASDFGVVLKVFSTTSNFTSAFVDAIWMRVHYKEAGFSDIYYGDTQIKAIKHGSDDIVAVYYGETKIFEAG